VIHRKLKATGSVSAPAPSTRSSPGRSGSTIPLTRAAASAMWRQDEVAMRRARPTSRAPSARDTSAPTAIIRPTLIDVVKNSTIVASPTPAVRRGSPSQEM
jgi:hypothetical protein